MRNILLKKNSIVIGGITFDEIYIRGSLVKIGVGGGVYYSSLVLRYLGLNPFVLTNATTLQKMILEKRVSRRIYYNASCRPIVFKLVYRNGERELHLISPGETIPHTLLPSRIYDFAIVNPVYHEVDLNLMKKIRQHAKIVALDIQGLVRFVGKEQRIVLDYNDEINEFISYSDIIHADYRELKAYTQQRNLSNALEHILKISDDKIWLVTYGEKPIILVCSRKKYYFEPPKTSIVDETGAGDAFLAAFTLFYTNYNEIRLSIEKTLEIIKLKLKGLI